MMNMMHKHIGSEAQTSLKDSDIAEQAVLLSPAECAHWEIMNKTLWKAAIRNCFPETAGNKTFTQLLRLQRQSDESHPEKSCEHCERAAQRSLTGGSHIGGRTTARHFLNF